MPAQTSYYNRQRIDKTAPNLFKLVPFYALWIVLILVLIIYLVNRQGEIEQNQQDAGLLTLKQSTSTIAVPKVTPTASVTTPAPVPHPQTNTEDNHTEIVAPAANDAYRVTLKAKNHVWVEVKAVSNGESLFNGFLEAGDSHDFSDKEGLRIRSGNAGNVIVTASGKTTELGAAGKIAEKIFTSNKVSKVAESQTGESTNDSTVNKTVSSSTEQKPIAKKPVSETTTAKKSVSETTIAKKPAVEHTPPVKPRPAKENLPVREAATPSAESTQSPSKAIDVPYRYSE